MNGNVNGVVVGNCGIGGLESEYIRRHHKHDPGDNQCSSVLVKHIKAPVHLVPSLPMLYLVFVYVHVCIFMIIWSVWSVDCIRCLFPFSLICQLVVFYFEKQFLKVVFIPRFLISGVVFVMWDCIWLFFDVWLNFSTVLDLDLWFAYWTLIYIYIYIGF